MLDLDRSFGFLVNDVARLFGRRFDHNGQQRRLGLTRAQCRILGYLARNEGINQAGLADLLEIRPMISLGSCSGSAAGSSSSFSSFGFASFFGDSGFFSLSESSAGFAFFFNRTGGSG